MSKPKRGTKPKKCKPGEMVKHGDKKYRWCATHGRYMIACESFKNAALNDEDNAGERAEAEEDTPSLQDRGIELGSYNT